MSVVITDIHRMDFLTQLNDSIEVEVSDWEMAFILDNQDRAHFSGPQRDAIDRIIVKYAEALGWKPDDRGVPF